MTTNTPSPDRLNYVSAGATWKKPAEADRPPNLTSSQAISQHEVIVRQYDLIVELRDALSAMAELYVDLADSGDCGFWYAEDVPQVKDARAALAKADSYLK
jgi:hypothetical protein